MPKKAKAVGVSRDDMIKYLTRDDITDAQRRLAELKLEYSDLHRIAISEIPSLSVERIYPTILPIQVTGRWSYIKPSLSNFSKKCINPSCPKEIHNKTDQCWGMVDCVQPDAGTFWIEHDLDAVEHRIYALILGWQERLQQLQQGYDIHTPVACELFNLELPSSLIDPHESDGDFQWRVNNHWGGKNDARRTIAKNITYGGQYFYVQIGKYKQVVRLPYRIYKGLIFNPSFVYTIPNIQSFKIEDKDGNLTAPDLEEIAIRFFESTVEIQRRKAEWQEKCRKDKYARTLYGGIRRAFFETADNAKELFNSIIQGTVASYINESAILLQDRFPNSYLVHNKHDSLKWAFYYQSGNRQEEEAEVLSICKEICQRPLQYEDNEIMLTATFKITRREDE